MRFSPCDHHFWDYRELLFFLLIFYIFRMEFHKTNFHLKTSNMGVCLCVSIPFVIILIRNSNKNKASAERDIFAYVQP